MLRQAQHVRRGGGWAWWVTQCDGVWPVRKSGIWSPEYAADADWIAAHEASLGRPIAPRKPGRQPAGEKGVEGEKLAYCLRNWKAAPTGCRG